MTMRSFQDELAHLLHVIAPHLEPITSSGDLIRYMQTRYRMVLAFVVVEFILVSTGYRKVAAFILSQPVLVSSSICYLCAKERPTEEDVNKLIEDWTPEPLVEPLTPTEAALVRNQPVITGPTGPRCKLTDGRTVANLASYDFYNLTSDERIKQRAIHAARTYGVGPCSAPNFYGTQDIHQETEAKIASILGTESCIIYSQAFVTASSMIPSFAKCGDVLVADIACNYAIRKGLQISRSKIYWYKHNDMGDLERILEKIVNESKNLTRRFIVTEGLFENTGGVAELPKIIELKTKYKFRLMLDETWSFGVLGKTGRGITEAQNVDISRVDMLLGSLSGPLSGGGGFCASSREVVEHQRISSAAYCYSCALPAVLAASASAAIDILQTNPEVLTVCRENVLTLRTELARCQWVESTSSSESPIQLFVLAPRIVRYQNLNVAEQAAIIQDCVDECLARDVLITRLKCMPTMQHSKNGEQGWVLQPALKVCVNAGLDKKNIKKFGATIGQAISKVLTRKMTGKLTPTRQ